MKNAIGMRQKMLNESQAKSVINCAENDAHHHHRRHHRKRNVCAMYTQRTTNNHKSHPKCHFSLSIIMWLRFAIYVRVRKNHQMCISYDFKLIKINCVAKGRTYFENKKSAKKPNKQAYIQQMRHTTHRNENLLLLCMAHLHPSDLEEKNRKTVHIP